MNKWARLLRNIYLTERYRNQRKAKAARRDHYRHLQGLPMIYASIHKLRIPESEFEPNLVRDSEFVNDSLHPMERRRMKQKDLIL